MNRKIRVTAQAKQKCLKQVINGHYTKKDFQLIRPLEC